MRHHVFTGLSALLAAAALLIPGMNRYSLWVDEVRLIRAAEAFQLSSIYDPGFLDSGIHPPVLYIVLKAWMSLVGDYDLLLSAMSVFFGLLAAAWIYRATVDITRTPAAGMAAVLVFASLGFVRYYTHQVHNYGIFLMLAAGMLTLYGRWLRQPQRRSYAAGIVIFAVLLLYTHYYSVIILGALSLHALLHHPRRWLLLMGISGLLFAPWLPALYRLWQGLHFSGSIDGGITNYLPSDFEAVLRVMRALFFERPEIYLLALLAGALFMLWRRTPRRRAYLALLGFVAGSFALALLFNEIVATLFDRRMIFTLVAVAVACGVLFAELPRRAGSVLVIGLVVIGLSAPRPVYLHGDWAFRPMMSRLAENVLPGDLVFFQVTEYWHSPYHLPLDYYAEKLLPAGARCVMQGARSDVHTAEFANEVFAPQLEDHERFWIVRPRDDVPVPEHNCINWVYTIQDHQFKPVQEIAYTLFTMTLFINATEIAAPD
jgi:hypothetical protein